MTRKDNDSTITDPGRLIKQALMERGLTQKEFALTIGVLPSRLSEIVRGKRKLTLDFAKKMEDWLNLPAKMLLDLQTAIEIVKHDQRPIPDDETASLAFLRELDTVISIKTLLKGTHLSNADAKAKAEYIKCTFDINRPAQIRVDFEALANGCFRKSAKTGLDERMIATWVVIAKAYAIRVRPTGKFNIADKDKLLTLLTHAFHANVNTKAAVTKILDDFGIVFKEVPKIERASIDGFSFIENSIPYIIITCRYNRIDNLAFTVMHELGHILLGHTTQENPKINIDLRSIEEDNNDVLEERANEFASEALIPSNIWKLAPITPMIPYIIQRKYSQWAEKRGLNKWIVLGRLSHETGMYKFKSDASRLINTTQEGGQSM